MFDTLETKWRSPRRGAILAIAGVGLLILGGGVAYRSFLSRPTPQVAAIPKSIVVTKVSALGRLEPQGEVIQVFAPTSQEGARVELLKISHGQQLRRGDPIAVLDTYARRQAALTEAQEKVKVARLQLQQVQSGAKTGDIQAQREKVGQIQAELTKQSAAQRAVVARIVAERETQIAAQRAVVARIVAERETQIAAQNATISRIEAQVKNAALENRRYRDLYLSGAVGKSSSDSKLLTLETTQQQLVEARANLDGIKRSQQQQIQEARANLDGIKRSQQQQIQEAQENLAGIIASNQKQLSSTKATLNAIAEVRPVDVATAQGQVAQAQASVARAQADLDAAIVRSPQDGQVLKIHTRAGELVGTDGIISLGQTQQMVAVAEVYESDVSRIRQGQSATAISKNNAFPDVLRGKVVEVGLRINKQDVLNTDPAAQFDARVVEVRVLLDEPSSRKVTGLTNLSLQVDIDI